MQIVENNVQNQWKPKYAYKNKTGRPVKIRATWVEQRRARKHAARKRVRYALKIGRIVKADHCEFADCKEIIIQAHHPDYNLPLDVVWLCKSHHSKLHTYLPYL